MGQGPVAEGVRQEFRGLVGNFLTTPSAESYLKALDFTRKMMQSFKQVPNIGQEKVESMTGRPASIAPATPAVPNVGEVRKGYRFKGGDPSQQSNWEPAQ
jgi:hypothetical protein